LRSKELNESADGENDSWLRGILENKAHTLVAGGAIFFFLTSALLPLKSLITQMEKIH